MIRIDILIFENQFIDILQLVLQLTNCKLIVILIVRYL